MRAVTAAMQPVYHALSLTARRRCRPALTLPSRVQTEGEAFQQLLVAALKGVTRRVLLADQSVEYILKE